MVRGETHCGKLRVRSRAQIPETAFRGLAGRSEERRDGGRGGREEGGEETGGIERGEKRDSKGIK